MKLVDLLQKVSTNPELKIRIIDGNTDIVTFNAAGYPAVNDELKARDVEKIIFSEDMKLIKVYLELVPPEPDPEPDEPVDPDNP